MFNFPIKIAMLNHLKIHQFWDRPIRFCWYMHQALPPPPPQWDMVCMASLECMVGTGYVKHM